jgi:hypothetical protein
MTASASTVAAAAIEPSVPRTRMDGAAVMAASGPGCDRRRQRLTGGHCDDWSGQLVDSGLAGSEAADGMTRELDRAYLKRPDRVVEGVWISGEGAAR